MKCLLIFLVISFFFGSVLSDRRHNTKDGLTKILDKIKPDSELCNEENCPPERGTCSGENFCFCFDGYISSYESSTQCDYEQKDRTLYFLLEFVLSFGIGHLYAGHYIYGIIKMLCYVCLLGIYFIKFAKKKGIDAARIRLFIWVIISIWQMIDGISIFKGTYTDGNDKPTGFKYF